MKTVDFKDKFDELAAPIICVSLQRWVVKFINANLVQRNVISITNTPKDASVYKIRICIYYFENNF